MLASSLSCHAERGKDVLTHVNNTHVQSPLTSVRAVSFMRAAKILKNLGVSYENADKTIRSNAKEAKLWA